MILFDALTWRWHPEAVPRGRHSAPRHRAPSTWRGPIAIVAVVWVGFAVWAIRWGDDHVEWWMWAAWAELAVIAVVALVLRRERHRNPPPPQPTRRPIELRSPSEP